MRTAFVWLDSHPGFYWVPAALSALILVAWIVAEFRPGAPQGRPPRIAWIFSILLLAFILAWRWPFLLCAHEYNPDESQFVAGALTLARDPVFWRSVDGTTSGPLNFYALLPLHWVGLPLDYFTARLTGLLLVWGMLCGLRGFFRQLASPAVATAAILPAAVFFATVTEPDFIHYSSEAVPLALLVMAIACAPRRPILSALAAGLLPWAKLQALPLAAAFVAWQLVVERFAAGSSPWRGSRALLIAAAAPSLLAVGLVVATGQFSPFWHRYVLQNIAYAGGGGAMHTVVQHLWHLANDTRLFTILAGGSLLSIATASGVYWFRHRRPSRYFWLGAMLSGAALFAVLLPVRPSLHYVLFLFAPLALWSGAAVCDLADATGSRRALSTLSLVLGAALLAARLQQPPPELLGRLAEHWQMPRTALGEVLHSWRKAGARLSVWGWMNSAYAESGLPQGVRDMLTIWSIQPSPQRDYYRAGYLADFREQQPELFLDAVGPGAPFFEDRAMAGHETFPELATFVAEHYQPVIELGPARLYARRDFLASHPLGRVERQRLVARGRPVYDASRAPDIVVPASAPWTKVGERSFQMIEPPTELRWLLAGQERSVSMQFGFEPRAYRDGRTDGAEFIAELRMPGQPPLRIASRRLDPVARTQDRGPVSVQAELPPYPPGTVLAAYCVPGEAGNAAWDWLYFDCAQFARSPVYSPRQFPGFRRLPDTVAAGYPHLVNDASGRRLMLPPPATLTFVLDGTERHLNFSYGLAEGAYTGAGRTDGAIYEVELQRGEGPPHILFTRWLDPLANHADRGRQDADLVLPANVQAGDTLTLRIGAGGSASWDWTYVSALDLR